MDTYTDTADTADTDTNIITNDEEFLDHVKQVKKLLDVDIEDLKPQQAMLIREHIVNILEYVMRQMEEEEEEEEEVAPQPVPQVAPEVAPQPSPPLVGGRKSRKKQKGGVNEIDMKRAGNISDLVNKNHNPENIAGSPDIVIAANVPRSFTVSDIPGYSSTSGMSAGTVSSMLPPYGTQQGGGKRKSSKSSKKNKKSN